MSDVQIVDILPIQREFHEYDGKFAGLIGGLGAGKSKSVADWFIDRMILYPQGNHGLSARDLPQLKRGALLTIRGALEERKVQYTYNRADGTIRLKRTGAKLIPLTAENFLAWRSLEADTIWADELADWGSTGEEAFTRYLMPRLRYSPMGKQYIAKGMKPQLRFSTNPPLSTSHWLIDFLANSGWKYWHMSTRDNFLMPDYEEYVRGLESAFSPDLWPILIDGKFGNAMVGNVYKGWDRTVHALRPEAMHPLLPKLELDPNQPICWGLDFNVGMMCSVIMQSHRQRMVADALTVTDFAPFNLSWQQVPKQRFRVEVPGYQERLFYVLGELVLKDKGVPEVVQEFLARYGEHAKRSGVAIYGDASGGARSQQISSQSAARSNWQIILQTLYDAGVTKVQFRVPSTNPSVMDRINAVKAAFRTSDGIGFLARADQAPYLMRDFDAVKFVEGKNDIDKTDLKLTHISDACGYVVHVERAIARKEKINFINVTNR
jgi:hypothetical protein